MESDSEFIKSHEFRVVEFWQTQQAWCATQQRMVEPKLQSLIDMVDAEKKIAVEYITNFVDNSNDKDAIESEIKATARYRKYLDELKTKFTLTLNEAKKWTRKN